jgi:hypothetical protein
VPRAEAIIGALAAGGQRRLGEEKAAPGSVPYGAIQEGGASSRRLSCSYRICFGLILIEKDRSAKTALVSSGGGSATSTTSFGLICTVERNHRADR